MHHERHAEALRKLGRRLERLPAELADYGRARAQLEAEQLAAVFPQAFAYGALVSVRGVRVLNARGEGGETEGTHVEIGLDAEL